MRILHDSASVKVLSNVRSSERRLLESMARASSGQKIQRPGDAPTEFGISEMLRYQIQSGREAMDTIQNARNYIATADEWMQVTHDILNRMQELSIASTDGSKSQRDRDSLEMEFQQLRSEISRIARDSSYNGVQVAGRDQLLTYDQDLETFRFSMLDGSDGYTLDRPILSGVNGSNGIDFNFDPANDYMISETGQNIFYVDSNNLMTRYEIETGILTRDSANSESKRMDIDEQGRLWYAAETSAGSGTYQLVQQNVETWTADDTLVAAGDIADMGATEFQVYQDRAYYVNNGGDIVSRSLRNFTDVRTELDSGEMSFTTTAGQFAISEDGQFMADVTAPGMLRVTNMATKQSSTYAMSANVDIQSLDFGVDNQDIAFVDGNQGTVHRLDLAAGDTPMLSNDRVIHEASGALGMSGVSISGGSHRANIRIQNGPNAAQNSFVRGADLRLYTLGLSRATIASIEEAQTSLGWLQDATDAVSIQRARLGSEHSRLEYALEGLTSYMNNLGEVDGFLRDSDLAAESAIIAEQQVRQQASISLLSQISQQRGALVQMLQR